MIRHLSFVLALLCIVSLLPAPALAAPPTPVPQRTTAPQNIGKAEPEVPAAPSFGVFMGQENAIKSVMPDGTISYIYMDVPEDDYSAFGEALEESFAYQDTVFSDDGHTVSFGMINEETGISLQITYSALNRRLTIAYPAGTRVEEMPIVDPFGDDYIEVQLGQTIYTSYGSVSVDEIHLYDGQTFRVDYNLNATPNDIFTCWFGGRIANTSTGTFLYVNTFTSVTLYYINAAHIYEYKANNLFGGFKQLLDNTVYYGSYSSDSTYSYSPRYNPGSWSAPASNKELKSLQSSLYIAYWNRTATPPQEIAQATDGILALTFTINGVNYVIYLRR